MKIRKLKDRDGVIFTPAVSTDSVFKGTDNLTTLLNNIDTGTSGASKTAEWNSITGKPSTFTPSSHTHGTITDDGKLDSASVVVVTSSDKSITSSTITVTELSYLSGVTSDIQTQLDAKLASSLKGEANGIAELDENGLVPSSQLPSYVDDVLEFSSKSSFPSAGETGKIYVALDTNLTYRWSGSAYVEISPSIALGETSSTAYRGDKGKIAYDHTQVTSGNPHNVTCSEIGALPTTTTYAASSSVGGAATSANKLNSNAGSTDTPIYFANGVPVALSATIGGATTPVYLKAGVITAGTALGSWAYKSSGSASDVSLGNVTNNKQVKAISSATVGDIPLWNSATGDLLSDSGLMITVTSSGDDTIFTFA